MKKLSFAVLLLVSLLAVISSRPPTLARAAQQAEGELSSGFLPMVLNPAPTATPTATATPTETPTVTPTELPTVTATPTAVVGEGWLAQVNQYRAMAALPPVSEEPMWSQGDWLHARYMVKNDYIGHDEDPANPWYTDEGNEAAGNGNILVGSRNTEDTRAIDWWMAAPFHAVSIVDPALHQVGFGSYREDDSGWEMGATLDVARGLGAMPPEVSFPLRYPMGSNVPALTFWGGEWPNPLSSCPGYSPPTGAPILLQLGPGLGNAGDVTPSVTAHSLARDGTPLEHCVFDETSYLGADGGSQYVGRIILNLRDAVVLMPRAPLVPGASYEVSITANGVAHEWSFTVSPFAQPATRPPLLEMR